jgi:D-alanine-D-alanine ligase-like ATP-grasp enzyme
VSTVSVRFVDRLREALVRDPDVRFVLLGNFEVEEVWADSTGRLPGSTMKSSAAVVNRMEEFALSLGCERDYVIFKEAVDDGFAGHLAEQGLRLPTTLTVDENHPEWTITADALQSPRLLTQLRALGDGRTFLLPLGTSDLEEQLSNLTGLPLAVPSASICRRVNSKAYSRRVTDELGLRSAPGHVVESVEELRAVSTSLLDVLDRGGRIVVKEALGVSGKGVLVIDRSRRLEQLVAMLERRARRTGDARLDLVVEEWIDKACDLNYHFVIGADGEIVFDFVKEAVTERGVHKGHLMPSRLDDDQVEELRDCAIRIGRRLFADGYHGVVGVDAILSESGELYPILEINARFNMSTYQIDIAERCIGPGRVALARHYAVRLTERRTFGEFARHLEPVLFDATQEEGFLVNNFAAVNAGVMRDGGFDGRLYGICIAQSEDAVRRLDSDVEARVRALAEG